MPTRLIDVDVYENGVNPRLITTQSLGDAVVSYTTLSHAWGNPDIIPMCKKNNIEALHHDIDFDKLPKRYQDAVEVTRALDLRCLWIDTFCIVQDDEEDMTRELGRMTAIYSNAAYSLHLIDRKSRAEYTYIHWLGRWYSIIEEFTSRDVTFVQDRLNALAGLAETIASYIRPYDKYIAGLWQAGLPHHLFWIPHPKTRSIGPKKSKWPPPLKPPPSKSEIHHSRFRLPSWSWISVDGPVLYPYAKTFSPGQSYLFDETGFLPAISGRLAASVERTGTDLCHLSLPFGSVCSGYITIKGPVFEATMSEAKVSSTPGPPGLPKYYWIFDRKGLFGTHLRRDSQVTSPASGVVYFDSIPQKLPKTKLIFLRLGSGFSLLSGDRIELGLVLSETDESCALGLKGPLFRRVGIFEIGYWNKRFSETTSIQIIHIV
ncbi:hypothetical protein PENSTE_c002G05510 [Penicillium steckii]|uniref:Heterokaryon incompatibility domain-containing protein n=1 Tax=Penicillium steckii TaxID=303698 RepID=A0A1V6TTJ2_9EURO|nr:hypothetical protein PENSTE_c002G05510 [Penicillium steckii]